MFFTLYHLTAMYWTPGSDTAVHWRTQSEPDVDKVSRAIDVQVAGPTPEEHQSPDVRVHSGFMLGCTKATTRRNAENLWTSLYKYHVVK